MKKRSLKEYLFANNGKTVLNLGCGKTNHDAYYGIDIIDSPSVDLVANLENGIPLKENLFDVVFCRDFLEHLIPQKSIFIMEETYRVLKPGGKFEFMVPSTDGNNTAAFQDPTHYSFWNQMKFRYFYADDQEGSFRSLYNIKCHFKPLAVETYFNEWNVTYVRGVLQK